MATKTGDGSDEEATAVSRLVSAAAADPMTAVSHIAIAAGIFTFGMVLGTGYAVSKLYAGLFGGRQPALLALETREVFVSVQQDAAYMAMVGVALFVVAVARELVTTE